MEEKIVSNLKGGLCLLPPPGVSNLLFLMSLSYFCAALQISQKLRIKEPAKIKEGGASYIRGKNMELIFHCCVLLFAAGSVF